MKIVVFAGGVGTRLWPLSRKNTPKQFGKIIGDNSTLQQTVFRLIPQFNPQDIFVATGVRYKAIVTQQLPQIPKDNFIFEPEMRDVGPAIGLVSVILEKKFRDEPVAILWSDHLVKNEEAFRQALLLAQDSITKRGANFVFIGQKPRFPNQNIGWIELGEEVEKINGNVIHRFKKLRYRPKLSEAQEFFSKNNFVWNLGYFVTTPAFLTSLFSLHAKEMYDNLLKIREAFQTPSYGEVLQKIYPSLEKISFDDAILEKLSQENVYVISADIGWSDVGAWEALKEALSKTTDENVTRGSVLLEESKDVLLFNYTDALCVGIDLNEMLVINTEDVLLLCHKTSVPKIKKLVESLAGTPHEDLT